MPGDPVPTAMLPYALAANGEPLPIGPVGGAVLLVSLLLTVGWLLYLYR